MAKSIRSKCRRKSRTEFRNTIGDVAHKKNQEKIQEKLKDSIEKQSMKSLERLSNILQTSVVDDSKMDTEKTGGLAVVDAMESSTPKAPVDLKGENKIPVRMTKKRKHALAKQSKEGVTVKPKATREKQRPKYFCAF